MRPNLIDRKSSSAAASISAVAARIGACTYCMNMPLSHSDLKLTKRLGMTQMDSLRVTKIDINSEWGLDRYACKTVEISTIS